MKKTLITGFGSFLQYETNSSKEFINNIPNNKNLIKHIFPVGYFKNEFTKVIKKYKPQRIIALGLNEDISKPKFETVVNNQKITLKKPLMRFIANTYSFWLKLNKKNLRIKKPIPESDLIVLPINKHEKSKIIFQDKIPKFKEITISKDPGYFVCNYAMWVIKEYIRKHKLNISFYFIHLPSKLTKAQTKELEEFVFHEEKFY